MAVFHPELPLHPAHEQGTFPCPERIRSFVVSQTTEGLGAKHWRGDPVMRFWWSSKHLSFVEPAKVKRIFRVSPVLSF